MLVIIKQWAMGSGQWAIPEYCKLPTAHCLLFLRDRDRLALRRQFELVTPQIEGNAEMRQIISAKYPVLFKPRCFINRFEVQDHGPRVVLFQTIDRQRRQA